MWCRDTRLATHNTMTTHPFTCDDDILAFKHASMAFEYNRKRITINRCVVQLNSGRPTTQNSNDFIYNFNFNLRYC